MISMSEEIKNHTTVIITCKMLREFHACSGGLASVEHLLPATLSTDPDDNIELALELTQTERATYAADVYWLALCVGAGTFWVELAEYGKPPFGDWPEGAYRNDASVDPTVIAQWLAAIADTIATREGR